MNNQDYTRMLDLSLPHDLFHGVILFAEVEHV